MNGAQTTWQDSLALLLALLLVLLALRLLVRARSPLELRYGWYRHAFHHPYQCRHLCSK
jgi:hypothetical protein